MAGFHIIAILPMVFGLGTVSITNAQVLSSASARVCGAPVVSNRIVNGQDAVEGAWPWQVSLQLDELHVCGGSVINESWVVSAAHCYYGLGFPKSRYRACMGEFRLDIPSPHASCSTIKSIILNANFTEPGSPGDIMLLELDIPMLFSDYIMPVCLPASSFQFPAGDNCWVTGWGLINSTEYLPFPKTLQQVTVPLIDQETCEGIFRNSSAANSSIPNILSDMICAGFVTGVYDSCQGDSGGPLVCQIGGAWILAGVVSWGVGCAAPGYPGVYTRVTAYDGWIQESIAEAAQPTVVVPTLPAVQPVCGRPAVSTRIVDGQDALEGEWPWQVSLQVYGFHICGGSLISNKWVLSAAHCYYGLDYTMDMYMACVGEYKLSFNNPNAVCIAISQMIPNPNYNQTGSPGDIMLLELNETVTFTNYIMPVCLPSPDVQFPSGTICWVTGWGDIHSWDPLPYPKVLQKVMLPIIDRATCDYLYHIDSGVSDSTPMILSDMICAGFVAGVQDSCQGDSGGPLVCKATDTWFLAGVVSWGEGCALNNRPGVYTLVTAYDSWIQKYVPDVQFHSAVYSTKSPSITTGFSVPSGGRIRIETSVVLVFLPILLFLKAF